VCSHAISPDVPQEQRVPRFLGGCLVRVGAHQLLWNRLGEDLERHSILDEIFSADAHGGPQISCLQHHLHEHHPVMVVGLGKSRECPTAVGLLRDTVDDESF
jgi:hypothetical protein